jgi:hypothetical protein
MMPAVTSGKVRPSVSTGWWAVLAVELDPLVEEARHGPLGIAVVEEGAIPVAGGAADDLGGGDDEPDHEAEAAQRGAVLGPQNDAAARRDDAAAGLLAFEASQNGGFEVAEGFLSVVLENPADRLAGALHDEGVGVEDRIAEGVRQLPADGRLPGAHEADQNDVFRGGGRHAWGDGKGPKSQMRNSKFLSGRILC